MNNIVELRIILPDGRAARVPVNLSGLHGREFDEVIKGLLFEAYMSLLHFIERKGPELPDEVAKSLQ